MAQNLAATLRQALRHLEAERRAVSQRMRAYWAKRRAASAIGKARGTQKAE
jgi:hypothetical protein